MLKVIKISLYMCVCAFVRVDKTRVKREIRKCEKNREKINKKELEKWDKNKYFARKAAVGGGNRGLRWSSKVAGEQ